MLNKNTQGVPFVSIPAIKVFWSSVTRISICQSKKGGKKGRENEPRNKSKNWKYGGGKKRRDIVVIGRRRVWVRGIVGCVVDANVSDNIIVILSPRNEQRAVVWKEWGGTMSCIWKGINRKPVSVYVFKRHESLRATKKKHSELRGKKNREETLWRTWRPSERNWRVQDMDKRPKSSRSRL
jgi:hypothetical protein